MESIYKINDIDFGISNEFKSEYLTPITLNLLSKMNGMIIMRFIDSM